MNLPVPARYFPLSNGRYTVTPSLKPLTGDFGNGDQDRRMFQFDTMFAHYRQTKLKARAEQLAKYYLTHNYQPAVAQAVQKFIVQQLAKEHPQYFQLTQQSEYYQLNCQLTNETLYFDQNIQNLVKVESSAITPAYRDPLDALACQLQEDLAIVSTQDAINWLSAVHVTLPSYWAPAEKIGQDFAWIHGVVPGMERTNHAQGGLIKALVEQGPFLRFNWSVTTDAYLNHHPEPAPGHDPLLWEGLPFQLENPQLYLRVERQVLQGFAECGAFLFVIRTYLLDCATLTLEERSLLSTAIETMSPAARTYKRLQTTEPILRWLTAGSANK